MGHMDFPAYDDYGDEDFSDQADAAVYPYDDPGISLSDLWTNCCRPSLDIFMKLVPVFGACFAVFVVRNLLQYTGRPVLHLATALAGMFVSYYMHQNNCWIITVSGSLGLLLLRLASGLNLEKFRGPVVAVLAVAYVVSCELFLLDPMTANAIRGSQMIYLMKLISLAFGKSVSLCEYMGYIFLPGNLIFGPWIPLEVYRMWSSSDTNLTITKFLTLLKRFITSLLFAGVCLLLSNCLIEWLLGGFSNRWIRAYQVAASFRFSHYFVGFLSEATLTATGMPWTPVTKPLKIELPRSLVEVVAYWSVPMRNWLREFVFVKARMVFSVPVALFLTYSASSLLHGVSFQLSAVLLTLSVATYAENELRRKLARIFDACIEARACRKCSHQYKSKHFFVVATNIAFGGLAMFHLAYLGDMFDSSAEAEKGYNYLHTLSTWKELNFAGHYVILFTFFLQWLI